MEKVGEAAATRGDIQPDIGPVLQGSGSPTVWVGFMGDVRRNDEFGGGYPHGVPT